MTPSSTIHRLGVALLAALSILSARTAAAQTTDASQWLPRPVQYAFDEKKDISVTMDDGTVLSADEYFPTDPVTGAKATGRFPVLLLQTPYGKEGAVQKFADYLVRRGYVLVVADIRGFGKSKGQAAWFGARMGRDGAELVDWAANLDEADGKVGLLGCSYAGLVQLFTANSLSTGSPVKAMAPFCIDSNFYRDLTAFGGIPTQLVLADRVVTKPGVEDDPATDPFQQTIISEATGDNAWYNDYWKSLNVTTFMPKIVSFGIPILSESGWQDIFPGGNIDLEVAAQNASRHQPVDRALASGEVSDRYHAIVGNWTHAEHQNDTLLPILLNWFDMWLKGNDTGTWHTDKPFHLYMLGDNRWVDSATYPITNQAQSFYLTPPPPSLPGRSSTGVLRANEAEACSPSPQDAAKCVRRLIWAPDGPGATLTFDTEKLTSPVNLAGPGTVTLFVRSSRPDVELSATLLAVAPDGHAVRVSNGVQLGSHRALDPAASWYSSNGKLIRPAHYFTKARAMPVPINQTVRIDIELLPALMHIPAGYQLRLVVGSQPSENFRQYGPTTQLPNPVTPTPLQYSHLAGGVYSILFGGNTASAINLSVATDADLVTSKIDWGPAN